MLTRNEREERVRSIRAHLLTYMKTARLDELDKAMAELVILMDLEELASSTSAALADVEAAQAEVSGNWSRSAEEAELDALRRLAVVVRLSGTT